MNEKVFTLPVVEQISPYISQRQLDELPVVVVSHPKVRAAISLQGAHLLAYQPSGEQPIIWLSNNTPLKKVLRFVEGFQFVGLGLAQPHNLPMVLPASCHGRSVLMMKMKTASF